MNSIKNKVNSFVMTPTAVVEINVMVDTANLLIRARLFARRNFVILRSLLAKENLGFKLIINTSTSLTRRSQDLKS